MVYFENNFNVDKDLVVLSIGSVKKVFYRWNLYTKNVL